RLRPRPGDLQAHRRAPRRPYLGRVGARPGQHLLLHPAGRAPRLPAGENPGGGCGVELNGRTAALGLPPREERPVMSTARSNEDTPPCPFFRPPASPAAPKGAPAPPPRARCVRVLLVEDHPGDARLIQEHLAGVEGVVFRLERAD